MSCDARVDVIVYAYAPTLSERGCVWEGGGAFGSRVRPRRRWPRPSGARLGASARRPRRRARGRVRTPRRAAPDPRPADQHRGEVVDRGARAATCAVAAPAVLGVRADVPAVRRAAPPRPRAQRAAGPRAPSRGRLIPPRAPWRYPSATQELGRSVSFRVADMDAAPEGRLKTPKSACKAPS